MKNSRTNRAMLVIKTLFRISLWLAVDLGLLAILAIS
jgi:hypothetical protein